jgi:hypothetical protein
LNLKKVSNRFISISMNNLYGILCISMSVLLEYKPVNRFGAPNSIVLPLNYRIGLERMCQFKVICQVLFFFYIKTRLEFSQRGLKLSWHCSCEYLFNSRMLLLLFPLKWALINVKSWMLENTPGMNCATGDTFIMPRKYR